VWSKATKTKPNPPVSLPKALSRQNRWVQLVLVATRDSKITKQTLTLVTVNREKVAADFRIQEDQEPSLI